MGALDLDHEGVLPATAGGQSTLWENFDAIFEQTSKVDSAFGIEEQVRERWEQNVLDYERATGQMFPRDRVAERLTGTAEVTQIIEPWMPPGATGAGKSFFAGDFGNLSSSRMLESVERVRKIDEALKLANDPRFKSMDGLLQDVISERDAIRQRAGDVSSRAGTLGTIAGFAGGVAGSFTSADPLNILTLPLGFGRTAVARIGSEIGLNVATEGINQVGFVRPTQEALGEDTADLSEQLLFAAGGALAFQGAAEGLSKLGQRFLSSAPRTSSELTLDFEDAQLRGMFENAAASPRARAAIELLDEDAWVRANNPYGDTDVGLKRFNGELEATARRLNGESMTALDRVPGQQVSFDLDELDLDMQTVRAERPDVWARYQAAKAKVDELDGVVEASAAALDDIKLSDAIRRIDEDTADLVASYEADLQKPGLTRKQQVDIARKVDQIVQTLGEAPIERALADAAITPKFDLRTSRNSRKAAKAELRKEQLAVDAEVKRIQASRRVMELRQNKEAAKSVAVVRAGRTGDDLLATHPEVVSAQIETVELLAPKIDDAFWDELLKDSGLFEVPKLVDGKVVIDGRSFDPTMQVPDLNDPAKSLELGAALEDLQEDVSLIEAMRTCSV